jgi:uncharacterized protein (TIGR04255 family)
MELSEYESRTLANSPLVLVAAQVNFEDIGRDIDHTQARKIQREVGTEWVQLQPAPLVTATMTPGGAVNEPKRQAYRLLSQDEKWSIFIRPDGVSIETTEYLGWTHFSQRFATLCTAVSKVFDPALQLRIGLRYVDKISMPSGKESWDGLISDSLLGIASDSRFKDGIMATDQRALIQYPDGSRCVLRHGLFPDEGDMPAFLLDFDVFLEGKESFNPSSISEVCQTLHEHNSRTFRTCLTEELYEFLGGGS